MKKKMLLVFGILFTLALVALSIPSPSEACHRGTDHGSQICGGSTIKYEATLTMGGFTFAPVEVTPNSMENELRSNVDLNMNIPSGHPDIPATWNGVFNTCGELLNVDAVDFFTAVGPSNWKIVRSGGVRVIFNDILFEPDVAKVDAAEVTVQLVGNGGNELDFVDSFLPTLGVGDTSRTYILDSYIINGSTVSGVHPRMGCQPPGGGGADTLQLLSPSELMITAEEVQAP